MTNNGIDLTVYCERNAEITRERGRKGEGGKEGEREGEGQGEMRGREETRQ